MERKDANTEFDPVAAARRVLRLGLTGSLATLDGHGGPFASLVTVATAMSGQPILLLSTLAVHTQNLKRDPRASLLLVAPGGEGGDPLAGARLTVNGRVATADDERAAARFLARHPEARGYAAFRDFAFYRIDVESAHLVAGFGRIVDIPAADLLLDLTGFEALVAAEAGAIAHMNEDHADAVALYATRLLGLPDGPWRLTGLDPLGIDLICNGHQARLDFATPLPDPGALRQTLVALAAEARARAA